MVVQMPEKTKDFEISTKVYLDHNATTPVAEEIISNLTNVVGIWGNPSSIHWAGRAPKSLIREARLKIAELLGGVSPLEVIFTSGGSESNSCIIRGIYDLQVQSKVGDRLDGRTEYITTTVEHPSVLKSFQWLERHGATVHYLPVNLQGEIDLDQYQSLLSQKTALVSIMMANNETGIIFPTQKFSAMAHAAGAYFHSDGVQALGKISLNLQKLDVDFASFSAHKMYALKGTGVLYAKKGAPVEALIIGGGQERHRRGGTENTLGIWAVGTMAAKLTTPGSTVAEYYPKIQELRDYFEKRVLSEVSDVSVTGGLSPRLPNTSSLILNGVDGEILLVSLDLLGFAVSTGAACSSGNPEPSPVLISMGLSRAQAQNSLRISLGYETSKDQIDQFIEALKATVVRLRKINSDLIKQNFSDAQGDLNA